MSATKQYRFGVITDEIDQDFAYACQVASEAGMEYVEIHTLWGKNVDELSDEEVEKVAGILEQHGLSAYLICGLLFRPVLVGGRRVGDDGGAPALPGAHAEVGALYPYRAAGGGQVYAHVRLHA